MLLSVAIAGFNVSLLADGRSAKTLKTYNVFLHRLVTFLNNPDVTAITTSDLRRFLAWTVTEYEPDRPSGDKSPLASSSVSKIWVTLRSFFRWVSDEFDIPNPALVIKRPRFTTKAIVPFSESDVRKLLKSCEPTRPAKRNAAVVLVLLDTGLRAGELCRLKLHDLSLETGELTVVSFGSGRKSRSRVVYLGKSARRSLWRYLAERVDARQDEPLFLTDDGRNMTPNTLRLILLSLAKRAGVTHCHPHRFRHTFAITFLRNGGDAFSLQRLLGHSSLDMTKHYLMLADSDAQLAHMAASPADRWHL